MKKLFVLFVVAFLAMASASYAGDIVIKLGSDEYDAKLQLSMLTKVTEDEAFMSLYAGLSVVDVQRVWNDFRYLEKETEIRTIHIFIYSPGGDAFAGLALADEIERAKINGFKIIAHASGLVASATVPVFASCGERIASPGTIFMVHQAGLWKWPGRESASDIRAQNELMTLLQDRYIAKLVQHTSISADEWKAMEVQTTWFHAEKAMEIGLVDKIE